MPPSGKGFFGIRGLPVVVLGLLVFSLYLNTLDNGFVLDDTSYIESNHLIRDLGNLPLFFDVPEDAQVEDLPTGFLKGRNLRWVSYAVDYALGGGDPFWFHLSNLLWHLAAVCLFCLVATQFLGALPAFVSATIFAAHPVQTAAVAYVSGRKDLMATTFLLAALVLFLRHRDMRGLGALAAFAVFFFLGFFSKEVAVVLPGLMLAAEIAKPTVFPAQSTLRHRLLWHGTAWLLAAFFLFRPLLSVSAGGAGIQEPQGNLGVLNLLGFYFSKMLLPTGLLADYRGVFKFDLVPEALGGPLGFVLLAGLLLFLLPLRASAGSLLFGFYWTVGALVPVSHLVPNHHPVAEHYLYLPLAGFALMAGWVLARAIERFGRVALVVWLGGLVAYSVVTVQRNEVWASMETVTLDILEKAPGHVRALNSLVHIYMERGNDSRALEYAKKAIENDPKNAITHYNLGVLHSRQGNDKSSLFHYREAIRLRPNLWDAYINLADALFKSGSDVEGRGVLSALMSHYGYHPLAPLVMGNAYARKGLWPEALGQYRQVVRLNPNQGLGHFTVAFALWKQGDLSGAASELRKAKRLGIDLEWIQTQTLWVDFLDSPVFLSLFAS